MKVCNKCGCTKIIEKRIKRTHLVPEPDNLGYAIDMTKHIVGGGAIVGVTVFAAGLFAEAFGVRVGGVGRLAKETLIDKAPKKGVKMINQKYYDKTNVCAECQKKWTLNEQDEILVYSENSLEIKIDLNSKKDRDIYLEAAKLKNNKDRLNSLQITFKKSIDSVTKEIDENSKNKYAKLEIFFYATEGLLVTLIFLLSFAKIYHSTLVVLYTLLFAVIIFHFTQNNHKKRMLKKEKKIISNLLKIQEITIHNNLFTEKNIEDIKDNIKDIESDIYKTFSGRIKTETLKVLSKNINNLLEAKVLYFREVEKFKNN